MSLHGLLSVTMGVPNVAETAAYYTDFGLAPSGDGWLSTTDAGRQLRIEYAPTRRLVELRVAADDADDLSRIAASLTRLGVAATHADGAVQTTEPATGT
ncbi:MAG: dioxygenase, partial [Streptosporangiaceae bacterium]